MDDLLELLNTLSHVKDFDRICISLASPERIRSWSYGEIKTPETINYRTFKPEHEGLFCAKTFGPIKNYECLCGKYKLFKHQGIVCERCDVEVTKASVRRERMGHIELAAPIAHIWYLKSLPSRLGLLLDMPLRDLERILYFEAYVVIDPGSTSLKRGQLLSDVAYLEKLEVYGQEFDARMGGEAINELLHAINLPKLLKQLQEQIKSSQSETFKKKLRKRLMLVQAFLHSGNQPEWMILKVLPVLPPDLRPLVQFEGARFVTSDLNDLYRRVINRNNRTKRLLELKAPEVIIHNELRMLQESVDALLDNGRRHKVFTGSNKLQLQSLSDMIKGKQGRFRQNLLGKRVDYSGRTVIIVGPTLKLHQCGLPKEMALELFKPFLFEPLQKRGIAVSINAAKKLIEQKIPVIWEILDEVVLHYPVLLNRTPTLSRLGIQAFEPVLIEGKAIQLHPLICQAFNAHFDGDQMAVHIPLSLEAQLEARVLMMSTHNLLSPANGKSVIAPSAEMVLGLYYMTTEGAATPMVFVDINEIERAYETGLLELSAKIEVRLNTKRVKTTVGRALLSQSLPKGFPFDLINRCLTQEIIIELIEFSHLHFSVIETLSFANKLMSFGFTYATRAGISLAIKDMVIPKQKWNLIHQAKMEIKSIQKQYLKGLLRKGERYNKIVNIWKDTNDKMIEAISNQREFENALYIMKNAGVQSLTHIHQLSGMCGLMRRPDGLIFETPITANFREGLDMHQYFLSTHSTRQKLSDNSLKTANAGYLTRRLVDVAQDLIIAEQDCGTSEGLNMIPKRVLGRVLAEEVSHLKAGILLDEEKVKSLEGITQVKVRSPITCQSKQGICALCYGRDLASGKLVHIGEAIGVIAAQSIGESGTKLTLGIEASQAKAHWDSPIITEFSGYIRFIDAFEGIILERDIDEKTGLNTLMVKDPKLWPSDTTDWKPRINIVKKLNNDIKISYHLPPHTIINVEDGAKVNVGDIIASIPNKAHSEISNGLPRVIELFEARTPKEPAILALRAGTISFGKETKTKYRLIITDKNGQEEEISIPKWRQFKHFEGQEVELGDIIVEGQPNPHDILRLKGINELVKYLVNEMQDIYISHGILINDKHFEVIIRQMLRTVTIVEQGDTPFCRYEIMTRRKLFEENERITKKSTRLKTPALWEPKLLGITKASLATESFISAASFMDTTRVLLNSAINSQKDNLQGLKENVIIGRLIPAGTGLSSHKEKRN